MTNRSSQLSDPPKNASKMVKTVTSQELFGVAQLVEIKHGAEIYQLRLTKSAKLILTK